MDSDRRPLFERIKQATDLREFVAARHEGKTEGNRLVLLCPLHAEGTPSCHIYADHYHCYGCGAHGDLIDWLEHVEGRERADAIREAADHAGITLPLQGVTLETYAAFVKLPVAFLRSLGISEVKYQGAPAVRLQVFRPDGSEAAIRYRVALSGTDRFRWRKGDKAAPHVGWDPTDPPESVAVVEGPSDWQILTYHEIPALGLPANHWNVNYIELVSGVARPYVIVEPGESGEALIASLEKNAAPLRDRIWLCSLEPYKDVRALHSHDPEAFRPLWEAAIARAVPLTTAIAERRREEMLGSYAEAKDLLNDPNLLDRVGQAMRSRGYAGDLAPALTAYLALTSRLTKRPVNLAFVSPSASGKNFTADTALGLMPAAVCYQVSATSPRALVFSEECFSHRFVVLREADSISDDGPAASIMRAIADDGEMKYAVVEKDGQGRHHTREIVKPGPTGLLTTSTRSLSYQLGTRVLEIALPDDEERNRAILKATAARHTGDQVAPCDLQPFHAVQRYLVASPIRCVHIPYAPALADTMPATVQRMTRDFDKLLSMIEAHTLLYQCQREQCSEDTIVATLADYAAVQQLLAPVFESIAGEGVTPAVRETVEAINVDEEVSEAELVQRLGLAKSTINNRVRRAIKGGWLVNMEERGGSGHPKRLKRGAELPEAKSVLPTVEELKRLMTDSDSNFRTLEPESSPGCQIESSNGSSSTGSNSCTDVQMALIHEVQTDESGEFESSNQIREIVTPLDRSITRPHTEGIHENRCPECGHLFTILGTGMRRCLLCKIDCDEVAV